MTPHTITHRWVPSAHTLNHTQRDTSIDGAHRTLTKSVPSAQIIEDAFCHMAHIFAETSDCHP